LNLNIGILLPLARLDVRQLNAPVFGSSLNALADVAASPCLSAQRKKPTGWAGFCILGNRLDDVKMSPVLSPQALFVGLSLEVAGIYMAMR
jgi:hypothetical protein